MLRPGAPGYSPRRKENLFLWTVFLLLLVGLSMTCWIGSYFIFSRPELPLSYKILRKIKKIELPQRFRYDAAPQGEFVSAEKLYERYNGLSPSALRELNRQLIRSYLRNYPPSSTLVTYITGRFTVLDSYELAANDFIPSGAVVLAGSDDNPKLRIENIYSADRSVAPIIKRNLSTGKNIELRRTYDLTTVLHVTKLPSGIQLTVLPLNYGSYLFTGADGGFATSPPIELHLEAGWPLVRDNRRDDAEKAYNDFRQRSGLSPLLLRKKATAEAAKPPETAIKGVDVPLNPAPTPAGASPAPTAAIAQASPAARPRDGGKPQPPPASTPTLLAQNSPPPPLPAATPREIPVARAVAVEPTPVPSAVRPSAAVAVRPAPTPGGGVIQPFLATVPAGAGGAERKWAMYPPGRAPEGKNLRVADVAGYSRRIGQAGEPQYYLNGQFVVRAIGENRMTGVKSAVMRPVNSESNIRIIVEYPSNRPAPTEGTEVNRDEQQAYQILSVRQVPDGTLNVYAREIIER